MMLTSGYTIGKTNGYSTRRVEHMGLAGSMCIHDKPKIRFDFENDVCYVQKIEID